jgi:hypothetical protein
MAEVQVLQLVEQEAQTPALTKKSGLQTSQFELEQDLQFAPQAVTVFPTK